jgi:hypothetical protein
MDDVKLPRGERTMGVYTGTVAFTGFIVSWLMYDAGHVAMSIIIGALAVYLAGATVIQNRPSRTRKSE